MGWYGNKGNRKYVIEQLTAGNNRTKCIRHCFRGNAFRGVLWQVWECSIVSKTFITVDILEYRNGQWYNKPLDESMGPYYYSCPLAYLDLAPVENAPWRETVKAYHAKAKLQREERKNKKKALEHNKALRLLKVMALENFLNMRGI